MSINSATIGGRLTRDPELRFSKGGNPVCNAAVAVDLNKEKTGFFDVVAFDQKAEFLAEYGRKGDYVVVQGRLNQERWEQEDGTKRRKDEIIADRLEIPINKKREDA